MRRITVKELATRSLERALEEERARRMRLVFEGTEPFTEEAVERWRRARRSEGGGRRFSPRVLFVGAGLLLASGSALAVGAPEVLALVERWSTSKPSVGAPAPATSARRPAALPSADSPFRAPGDGDDAVSLEGVVTKPPARVDRASDGPARGSVAERVDSARWRRVTEALERGDLVRARAEAERLGHAGSPEARDAARLVALQIEVRQTGALSSASRTETERLARFGASAAIRREALRLVATPTERSEGSFE